MTKSVHVVGGVIVRDGRVLCAQRGASRTLGGKWEFPGGKVELGEGATAALGREIREELLCEVTVGEFIESTTHVYDFASVTLDTYWCELVSGEPVATEHQHLCWLEPSQLGTLDWAPADVPAVVRVRESLRARAS